MSQIQILTDDRQIHLKNKKIFFHTHLQIQTQIHRVLLTIITKEVVAEEVVEAAEEEAATILKDHPSKHLKHQIQI